MLIRINSSALKPGIKASAMYATALQEGVSLRFYLFVNIL